MVAGRQSSQRQSQWHQVQELFVFSLQIVWFRHDSSSPEIVISAWRSLNKRRRACGNPQARMVSMLYIQLTVAGATPHVLFNDRVGCTRWLCAVR